MKSMHIDAVANFPFPSPPDRGALRKAETVLTHLSALGATETVKTNQGDLLGGKITELGRAMSLFPVSPRFSRMLVSGKQQQCLPYVIAIVSALSVGDPFLREEALQGDEEENDSDGDLAHLTSGLAKVKEARKLRRKAFFQSQHVRPIDLAYGPFADKGNRLIARLVISPATSSGPCPSWGPMSMLVVDSSFARSTLFDQRYPSAAIPCMNI